MEELCSLMLEEEYQETMGRFKDSNAGSNHQNWGVVYPRQAVCKSLAPLLEDREPEEEDGEFN